MKIIVDAMGGDNAPEEIVKGALEAVQDKGIDVTLVGRGEEILRIIERIGLKELPRGIEIVNATGIIGMEDDPSTAIRTKKDSSLAVAFCLLRDGCGDACVSAGNTGAILSGATLLVKRVRGIRRAALAPVIPTGGRGFVLVDSGANSECTPEYLLQFAFMGAFYAETALGITAPRVGLLNNGSERTKGTQLQIETHALLEKARDSGSLNFIGNAEAKDAIEGNCDVLVCDGFTGNVLLKTLEGTAVYVMSELKAIFKANLFTKLSALMIKRNLLKLRSRMNPDNIGGTALLGISKPVIKAHGSSNANAICSAIRQAANDASLDIAGLLTENIDRMMVEKNARQDNT